MLYFENASLTFQVSELYSVNLLDVHLVDTIVLFEKHVITEDMSNLLPDISYFLQK